MRSYPDTDIDSIVLYMRRQSRPISSRQGTCRSQIVPGRHGMGLIFCDVITARRYYFMSPYICDLMQCEKNTSVNY